MLEFDIPLPPRPSGELSDQIDQMYRYNFQLAQQLTWITGLLVKEINDAKKGND